MRIPVFDIFNVIVLLFVCFICIYPFWNIYIYAFNEGSDSMLGALYFLPRKPTLANFALAFRQQDIARATQISVMRTAVGILVTISCVSLAGFAMSKRNLLGYKFLSSYLFITFMFSGGLIPLFLTIRELGLFNSFWVYIFPSMFGYWYMVLFRSFFDQLPKSVEESAWIDGASPFTVFTRLVFPMSTPVFAAITLFVGVQHWNDWFVGLFFVRSASLRPLQTMLQMLISKVDMLDRIAESGVGMNEASLSSVTPLAVRSAIVVITVTPIIMIYPFLQRYMVKGIMIGAVKG
jgi:putative aldouronate transport system permease protein